jgi:shikimate 5-dehydrogenase
LASCLNAAFAAAEKSLRCLPLEIGNLKTFRKLIDIAKLAGVVIDAEHQEAVLEFEPSLHGTARTTKAVDLLVSKDDTLHGFHKGAKVWVKRLENVLRLRFGGPKPLKDRVVMLAGIGPSARLLAEEVKSEGGIAILASTQKAAAQQFAKELGCRTISFEAIYTTLHDVLVVCDLESDKGKKASVHTGYLQPGIVVMDLTAAVAPSKLIRDAQSRSAAVVLPVDVFLDQALELARTLTNKPIEREVLARAVPARFQDD